MSVYVYFIRNEKITRKNKINEEEISRIYDLYILQLLNNNNVNINAFREDHSSQNDKIYGA